MWSDAFSKVCALSLIHISDAVSGYLVEMDQRPVRDVVASLL